MVRKHIPNIISIFRIVLFPCLLFLIYLHEQSIFAWLFFIALLSDILDGLLARMWKVQTEMGAKLDSHADVLTFLAGILGVLIFEPGFWSQYLYWILAVLVIYFAEVIFSLFKFSSISSFHTYASRIAAYGLGIMLMSLFWFGQIEVFVLGSLVISMLAYFEEILILTLIKKLQPDVKGLYWVWKTIKQTK